MKVEKVIWIASSPEEIFKFHVNHANRVDWHEHVVRSEKLTPGPIRIGTQFEIDIIRLVCLETGTRKAFLGGMS